MDMMGEEVVDDRAWIIKSHHPMTNPLQLDFVSNKVICIVRNPVDAMVSMISLINL